VQGGAKYVLLLSAGIDDVAGHGVELIKPIAHIYLSRVINRNIAASIRSALHIVKCAEAGANVCTCPLEAILGFAETSADGYWPGEVFRRCKRNQSKSLF